MCESDMISECGMIEYKKVQRGFDLNYFIACGLLLLYCFLIYMWLNPLPLREVIFWVFGFGIPHAFSPLLLTCHVAHVVRVFDARIEAFRENVRNNEFTSANELWDTFSRCRSSANELSDKLKYVVGIFFTAVLLAILVQGAAVFVFEGEIGSLTYMLLNIATLLWIMGECQQLNHVFSELCEDIIHMPVDSVLGPLDSNIRILFVTALNRSDSYPYMTAFGFIKFSMENINNAFILSVGSIGSVLWVSVISLFLYLFLNFFYS